MSVCRFDRLDFDQHFEVQTEHTAKNEGVKGNQTVKFRVVFLCLLKTEGDDNDDDIHH